MRGIELDVLLFGMFSPTLWRNICNRSFKHLQQRLLNTFTGNIARDRNIPACLANFVNFIDINDAALCSFNIKVGCLQEFQQKILNIFSDIASLGQRGCIANCEWHIENASKCPCEKCFSSSCWTNEKNVALVQFDRCFGIINLRQSLVVIVHCNGQ